ncbi:MAG TPA: 16S rRNA (cytosine(1402)-N(4))-methyltransferase [Acidimicrobiaceae bacterium]|nr:16S rRNA (cytosine(1402)-N(4))-methyltransferase [Acidimicrobiaceae bacterium]HCV34421.1 16S rRNA (cytosine(1402)-N(4))-methyltransferase [Acidimicrobiaceae bacterium]
MADRSANKKERPELSRAAQAFQHEPVMATEVLEALALCPPGPVLDATVGGGGHAFHLLECRPEVTLVGLDRDGAALRASGEKLAPFGDRVILKRSAFADLGKVLDSIDVGPLSGFLFDLGVSSPQIDLAERGFSYQKAGPLDMRMDPQQAMSAEDVVNGYSEVELARVFAENADEPNAGRIAKAIVQARPLYDTEALSELVRAAVPVRARRRGGHPAKRAFQAIRIEVNDELGQLSSGLYEAIERLRPGGRGAVLSYHSGEDRIVKDRFDRAATGGCKCPPRLPCVCGARPLAFLPRRSGRTPRPEEMKRNSRSISARLRVLERIETLGPA